jgi:hypothetical protein
MALGNGVAIANNQGVAILRYNARVLGNLGNITEGTITEGTITERAVVCLTHVVAAVGMRANKDTRGLSPTTELCAAGNAKTINNNFKPAYSITALTSQWTILLCPPAPSRNLLSLTTPYNALIGNAD